MTFPEQVQRTIQMHAVMILFSTGQNPPIIPQELHICQSMTERKNFEIPTHARDITVKPR
jgi:hypothetical protein